jgi:hypothetical protein
VEDGEERTPEELKHKSKKPRASNAEEEKKTLDVSEQLTQIPAMAMVIPFTAERGGSFDPKKCNANRELTNMMLQKPSTPLPAPVDSSCSGALVLDLDGSLIFAMNQPELAPLMHLPSEVRRGFSRSFEFTTKIRGDIVRRFVWLRPCLDASLEFVVLFAKEWKLRVVIATMSTREIVAPVLHNMARNHTFDEVYCREDLLPKGGDPHKITKDIALFCDPKNSVHLDDCTVELSAHPECMVQLSSFAGDPEDRGLLKATDFLEYISRVKRNNLHVSLPECLALAWKDDALAQFRDLCPRSKASSTAGKK